MVLEDAFRAAQRFLNDVIRPEHQVEIVINSCEEMDEGWAFAYDSRAFIEQGEISKALVGNAQIIVPKSGEIPYIREIRAARFAHRGYASDRGEL
jgi:hypothetical protein